MKIFKNKHTLQKEILSQNNISFIPTMGGLHKGHISLIKKSKKKGGRVLVSIFINPKQFNDKKDFNSYPRNISRDLKILKRLNIDLLYLPNYHDIFSFRPKNKIYLHNFSKKLCGKSRKGHFAGVVNVVNRFLEIINPKYIFLGLKDFQQLYLIKSHIKKNNIKTKVVSCKTVRETNGVACSTRNNNLSKKELFIASRVYLYLRNKKKLIKRNIKKNNFLKFNDDMEKIGVKKIDYIDFFSTKTLKKTNIKDRNLRLFIAYFINKIRLIDNV
jgi:pantoate--beta-alanine ligase